MECEVLLRSVKCGGWSVKCTVVLQSVHKVVSQWTTVVLQNLCKVRPSTGVKVWTTKCGV